MSGSKTIKMIEAYFQEASPTMFLSGFFQAPPQNFHESEEVEIDVVRGTEKVAIVVQDLSTGYRLNTLDDYTNKAFKPPVLMESFPIKASDLLKREAGDNPFADVPTQAKLAVRAMRGFRHIEAKIRRTIELQASQILQTGVLTLIDSAGVALYTLNFAPKATHFPTSSVTWGQAGADPLGDIESLTRVIRNDGMVGGGRYQMIFGADAWTEFLKDANVQKVYDIRNFEPGVVERMETNSAGGTYMGTLAINAYKYDLWLYDGVFDHPQTGVKTPYVSPEKVIIKAVNSRLDATFGNIPRIVTPDQRLLPLLPSRFSSTNARMDLHTNAWVTPDGMNMFGGVGARPLLVPTAIDTFGCLDTGL